MRFSIVIPLFNEENNILILIDEIKAALIEFNNLFEIIIIDDGSNDHTFAILNNLHIDNLIVLKNSRNYGQSYSLKKGINRSNNNTIITLDGDLQNNPYDIPKLISLYKSNNFKLIGGIRKNRKDSFIKIFSSYLANKIRMFLLNDDCVDTGCSLKIFDKNIFLKFPFFDGIHRFLPALFKGFGFRTTFVEVDHRRRYMGVSKYGTLSRLIWGIRDIYRVLRILKINKKNV